MRSSISSSSLWIEEAWASIRSTSCGNEEAASAPPCAAGAEAAESRSRGTSALRHLDPALAHRVHDGLGPVVDSQLPEDRAHVVLGGRLGDRQGIGDLFVG